VKTKMTKTRLAGLARAQAVWIGKCRVNAFWKALSALRALKGQARREALERLQSSASADKRLAPVAIALVKALR